MSKTYTIIAGVNGTGKSSLTGVLWKQRSDLGQIIDADKLASDNGGNNILAGRLAIQQIRDCLAKGLCFTQETTLSGSLTAHTAQKALDAGYKICMHYVGLDSAEESIARIANRVRKGGHDIPEADVRRRFEGRVKALATVLPYCQEALFYDNDNGFIVVGEYLNGKIVPYNEAPRWIIELAEAINKHQ